jgi:GTP:adenosylcobinamide-phosphate guanylyltransferase
VSPVASLILAGSRGPGEPLAVYAGVSHKALIEVGGRPMLERVAAALADSGCVERIAICIERPELLDALAFVPELERRLPLPRLAAASGPSASVASALAQLGTPLLVTTADHALLRPEWVRHFVERAQASGADVVAALARRETIVAAAPDTRRTYLRFASAHYSGCNLFYLATPAALAAVTLWQQIEAERKRPLRMLGRLGWFTALRYALGRLPLQAALARLGSLTAARVAVVEMPFGEAAIDVDKPSDLDWVRRHLGED